MFTDLSVMSSSDEQSALSSLQQLYPLKSTWPCYMNGTSTNSTAAPEHSDGDTSTPTQPRPTSNSTAPTNSLYNHIVNLETSVVAYSGSVPVNFTVRLLMLADVLTNYVLSCSSL